jgi:hypothetical protein
MKKNDMETRKGDKCPCGRSGRADNMKRHKAICAALKSFDVEFTKRQVKQWLTVSTSVHDCLLLEINLIMT